MTAKMIISILFYLAIAVVTIWMANMVKTPIKYSSGGNNTLHGKDEFLNKVYLIGIFVILFLCSALRYKVGNDYVNYTDTAHEAYVGGYVVTEIGFNKIVKLIYTLANGECYEVVFALFAFITLIFFLKSMYEQSVDFAFAFFIFMTLGLYFQTFNTMRYYLALSMSLYAMRYVVNRDTLKFLFMICIAALFHKSVLIVLPLYFIASFRWRIWQVVIAIIMSAGCYIARGTMLELALRLYPSYKNTIYLEGGTSPVSILRGIAIVSLYAWFSKKYMSGDSSDTISEEDKKELRLYAQMNLLAIVVYVFFSFLPVITRIGYYLSVSQILMIPLLVHSIPDSRVKKRVRLLIIIASVMYFAVFLLTAGKEGVGLIPYQSWLFTNERLSYEYKWN